MQMQVHIGLLYFVTEMKLFISIALGLNILIGNKNIKTNIFRLQANNSVMCAYFCIGFIDFVLTGKKLTDYTNLFSANDFKKKDDIILSYFKNE